MYEIIFILVVFLGVTCNADSTVNWKNQGFYRPRRNYPSQSLTQDSNSQNNQPFEYSQNVQGQNFGSSYVQKQNPQNIAFDTQKVQNAYGTGFNSFQPQNTFKTVYNQANSNTFLNQKPQQQNFAFNSNSQTQIAFGRSFGHNSFENSFNNNNLQVPGQNSFDTSFGQNQRQSYGQNASPYQNIPSSFEQSSFKGPGYLPPSEPTRPPYTTPTYLPPRETPKTTTRRPYTTTRRPFITTRRPYTTTYRPPPVRTTTRMQYFNTTTRKPFYTTTKRPFYTPVFLPAIAMRVPPEPEDDPTPTTPISTTAITTTPSTTTTTTTPSTTTSTTTTTPLTTTSTTTTPSTTTSTTTTTTPSTTPIYEDRLQVEEKITTPAPFRGPQYLPPESTPKLGSAPSAPAMAMPVPPEPEDEPTTTPTTTTSSSTPSTTTSTSTTTTPSTTTSTTTTTTTPSTTPIYEDRLQVEEKITTPAPFRGPQYLPPESTPKLGSAPSAPAMAMPVPPEPEDEPTTTPTTTTSSSTLSTTTSTSTTTTPSTTTLNQERLLIEEIITTPVPFNGPQYLPPEPSNSSQIEVPVCLPPDQRQVTKRRAKRSAKTLRLGDVKGARPVWHAGVYIKTTTPYMQICGGSVVREDVVLSAAHCFWSDLGPDSPENYAVAANKIYKPYNEPMDKRAQKSDVKEIILPPRYRGSLTSFQDDLAIVRLVTPFKYARGLRPVCLDFDDDFEEEQLVEGNSGTVAGWGYTDSEGSKTQWLLWLELPYVSVETCIARSEGFVKYITSDKICAGEFNTGKALCKGDSGGGLVFWHGEPDAAAPYLRGVASTAPSADNLKCNVLAAGSFTRVAAHRRLLRRRVPGIDDNCRYKEY